MMDGYTITNLDVRGFDGPVPNEYWSKQGETLLVMLPGLGYTNQMPLMFYLQEMAINRGCDILQVNYDYRGVPRETSAADWAARMMGDVTPVIDAALAKHEYKHVVLAGKSIGTRVMTTMLARGFNKTTAYIWLTPLLVVDQIRDTMMNHGPSVAVFGDKDYAVANVNLTPISQAGVPMLIVPDADHGLMIEGNVPESIAMLAHTMRELESWLVETLENSGESE